MYQDPNYNIMMTIAFLRDMSNYLSYQINQLQPNYIHNDRDLPITDEDLEGFPEALNDLKNFNFLKCSKN